MASKFSWGDDACEAYYKALLVNPFTAVNPVQVSAWVNDFGWVGGWLDGYARVGQTHDAKFCYVMKVATKIVSNSCNKLVYFTCYSIPRCILKCPTPKNLGGMFILT